MRSGGSFGGSKMRGMRLQVWLWLTLFALGGCAVAPPPMGKDWRGWRGANFLQVAAAPMSGQAAGESLRRLRATGADTVALIPYLRQDTLASVAVHRSGAVTDRELITAIDTAHRLGFGVVVKPQMHVDNSWAGRVDPGSAEGWRQWFDAYGAGLLHYARIAEEHGAEWLVIGTELNRAGAQPYWRQLIAEVRACYHGRLTYAAHNLEGVRGFAHWDLLDSVALSYYPALGDSARGPALRRAVEAAVDRLRALSRELNRPLWVMEFGVPSERGAQRAPWLWRHLDGPEVVADPLLQATVIDLWLTNLAQPWLEGALVWCWESDPESGGAADPHHTVQNKPAEAVLRQHWQP